MSSAPRQPSRSGTEHVPASQPLQTSPQHARRHPGADHQILGLITLFTVAILVVVAAVWALTAVGGWWMLALAVAVHLLASTVVLAEIAAFMTDQSLTAAAVDHIASRRRAQRKQPVAR
jgi:hypothetical protein